MVDEIRYYEINLNDLLRKLREALDKRDVAVAVLFGSALRRRRVRDVDVGVYLEGERGLGELLKLEAELESVLGVPVDLIPLDEAPPRLTYKALARGVRLVARDPLLLNALMTLALGHAQDVEIKYRACKRAR